MSLEFDVIEIRYSPIQKKVILGILPKPFVVNFILIQIHPAR